MTRVLQGSQRRILASSLQTLVLLKNIISKQVRTGIAPLFGMADRRTGTGTQVPGTR